MHRIPDTEFIKTPAYKVLTLTRKSRPATRFVNVGPAFNMKFTRELAKKQVFSQRKSRIRATRKNLNVSSAFMNALAVEIAKMQEESKQKPKIIAGKDLERARIRARRRLKRNARKEAREEAKGSKVQSIEASWKPETAS